MEERVPPAGDSKDDPPLSPPSSEPRPISETYIVQIPRDQIYRVPPPENAIIAESYHGQIQEKKRCCRYSRCLCISISLVTIAVIVGIIVGVMQFFVINPKSPELSITKLLVHNHFPSRKHNSQLIYDIYLKSKNPNERLGVSYENGGAKLSFGNHQIGGGKSPTLSQEAKGSNTIELTLTGSNEGLPKEVKNSLNGTKSIAHLSVSLTINAPIKMKSLLMTSSKDMTVTCHLKVDSLSKGTKILSQECKTKI